MAKRITQERVAKFAKENQLLVAGVPVVVALFALIVFLGAGEVTGYAANEVCAGTSDDPCWLIVNMTFKEDVFIYPFNNTALVLGTDQELEDLKLYRSWGSGWREIKMNETCKGTWCGGKGYEAKYVIAFREGRDYTLKFEALKKDPSQTVKWWFNPEGEWQGVPFNLGAKTCIDRNVSYVDAETTCENVTVFNETIQQNVSITQCNTTYTNKTKVQCINEGGIYLDGVNIEPEGWECSLRGVDRLECDWHLDSNSDGKCNSEGGETCMVRRYVNETDYVEALTNSQLPKYNPAESSRGKGVKVR